MKFIEKTNSGGKRHWELEIEATIPCTEEEQRIYGVKFKRDENRREKPCIYEIKFTDSDEVFYFYHSPQNFQSNFFKQLQKAKESLIKDYSAK